MTGFTRYLLRQLGIGMLFVTVGLTVIIWLSQSLRFIDMIVNRGLAVGDFIVLSALLLPNLLTLILPIALFISVVFVYTKIIADREIIIMRAAGLGQFALAKPAVILALATAAVGFFINLYLLPESYKTFRTMQWYIRNVYSHIFLKEGAFNNVSEDITVYVRERTPEGDLLGIFVHDKRNATKPYTIMARRGVLLETEDGTRAVMYKGNRQVIDEKSNRMSILYFDRYGFDFPKSTESIDERYREARERSFAELWNLADTRDVGAVDIGKFRVELHKRLTNPILGLAFCFVALAALLTETLSHRTQVRRVTIAVLAMVGLQGASLGAESIAAKNAIYIPLIYLNVLLPIGAGLAFILCRRPRWPGAWRTAGKTAV